MYCRKCGAINDDNAFECVNCGEALQAAPAGGVPAQHVANHLVFALVATLFCMPFGIVAIVYAAQVNGKLQATDYAGALNSSKKAAMWCWISFGLGLGATVLYLLVLYLFMMVIGGIAGGARGY